MTRLSKEREDEIRERISMGCMGFEKELFDEIDALRAEVLHNEGTAVDAINEKLKKSLALESLAAVNEVLTIRLDRYETDTTLDANLVKTMENQLWLHAEKIIKLEAENTLGRASGHKEAQKMLIASAQEIDRLNKKLQIFKDSQKGGLRGRIIRLTDANEKLEAENEKLKEQITDLEADYNWLHMNQKLISGSEHILHERIANLRAVLIQAQMDHLNKDMRLYTELVKALALDDEIARGEK